MQSRYPDENLNRFHNILNAVQELKALITSQRTVRLVDVQRLAKRYQIPMPRLLSEAEMDSECVVDYEAGVIRCL